MKRLLQGLALVQLFLVVALGVRIVDVWRTPLPEAGEIPDLPALTALPPPRPPARIAPTVAEEIVAHDLFDNERGQGVPEGGEDGLTIEDQPPVPPPSTVKLMGVMFIDDEPVGFLLDTNLKPEQQSVRKGEMFGEYEVGDISPTGLLLLGGGGQQFQIPLRVGAAAAAPAKPATAARTPPRPASARPAQAQNRNAANQRATTARERAQAIAKRNAEQRKNNARAPAARAAKQDDGDGAPDPAQARLEALRQLREAAKSR